METKSTKPEYDAERKKTHIFYWKRVAENTIKIEN